MRFFENYDFFHFQLFNMNFTMIFDHNFTEDCWLKELPTHPHAHETWEIYFVKRGTVEIDCKQTLISLSEKQFMFIPPEINHHVVNHDKDVSFGSIRFSFSFDSEDNIGRSIKQLLMQSILKPICATPETVACFDTLRAAYRDFVAQKDRKIWILPKFTSYCLHFLSSAMESTFELSTSTLNKYISQRDLRPMIVEFFMYYASKDFTISDLAESLNYSVSQTNRLLQQLFGKSFRSLMNETRIKKAKYFLQRSDLPISKISDLLGFKETKNFSKSFKSAEGVTPVQFRQQYQKKNL